MPSPLLWSSASPHLNTQCRANTFAGNCLNHLYTAWNKLGKKAFIAAFFFLFLKELERITTVSLSMGEKKSVLNPLKLFLLVTGLNVAQNVLASSFTLSQMYYVLTLAYKKIIVTVCLLLIHILHTSTRKRNLPSLSMLLCGSLAPLPGGDLVFYQEIQNHFLIQVKCRCFALQDRDCLMFLDVIADYHIQEMKKANWC